MKDLAKELEAPIEVRDATQVILHNNLEVHCFPDDRGFALITCKLRNEAFSSLIEEVKLRHTMH
ncbi:MAG: hypothetical protein ACFFFG_09905 [Candidatus Thorarchaeota archaeon]